MAEKRWWLEPSSLMAYSDGRGRPNAIKVMPTSEGEKYRRQRDQLLEAVRAHRDELDHAALHGPRRDRNDVDNALYNAARAIERGESR